MHHQQPSPEPIRAITILGVCRLPDETNEILQRLTRVETKLDLMINARDIAQEALQSTRSAHKRLDEMQTMMRWAVGLAVSSILSAIGILIKVVA